MRRYLILQISHFVVILMLISISIFFVSKISLSPAFALEPNIRQDKDLSDILEKSGEEGRVEKTTAKKLSQKELIHKIAYNFHSLSDKDKKNAFREFDRYFDELIKSADKNDWKDIGKEIQEFIMYSADRQKWYIIYFSRRISSTENIYQRKALIMGSSQQDRERYYPSLSENDTLQLFRLYDKNLIKILSNEEKIQFFSENFSNYSYGTYYRIGRYPIEDIGVKAGEEENIRRKIVNVLFRIADKTEENEVLMGITRQLAKRSLLQTPFDFERYINLLELIKAVEPGNMAILQRLRIARFRREESLWKKRAYLKLENDRRKLKNEEDLFLYKNHNDKYILRHPESWFCRGAVQYRKVRGGEYYSHYKLKYMESEDQFNPEEEIPGWNRWIMEFLDHPSVDDALYRLGRCYEIDGDYDRAIDCFLKVIQAPGGCWDYDADHRILFMLDVEMTKNELKTYLSNHPDSVILPEVLYSYGVSLMRDNNYEKAVSIFNELRKQYYLDDDDLLILSEYYYSSAGFKKNLKKQIMDCKELARLQEQIDNAKTRREKAAMLYKKGQFLYYRFLTFYNHLWDGGRVWYYLMSGGIRYDDEAPMTSTRIRREHLERRFYGKFYNRMQSITAFKQIPEIDPQYPDMDRVYYSIAMEYASFEGYQDNAYKYIDWQYGRAKYLEKLLKEYPDSSLADEAVRSYPDVYWYKKHKISQKEYIVRRYPFSDLGRKFLIERNISKDPETDMIGYHLRKILNADSVKDILMEFLKSEIKNRGDQYVGDLSGRRKKTGD